MEKTGDFRKVLRIGQVKPDWAKVAFSVFVEIVYKDGCLSLTGVEGPLASGNCRGGAGQIDMGF